MDSTGVATGGNVSGFALIGQAVVDSLRSPKLGSILALAAALTLGVGLILHAQRPDYVPVFERLDAKEAADLVASLNSLQIEYKIDPRSGSVLVPSSDLARVKMGLSASGFSEQSAVGFEMLTQEQSFGTSQFMENARYQHALETELGRTINGMRNVAGSRVHLALPRQSEFLRNKAKPGASVMVQPRAGANIESGQVNAIVNLVASSIPYLEASQVTVVDQWGRLLSSSDDDTESAQSASQYEHTRKLELLLSKRIESLLTPVVGEGKVRASISASIDFSSSEQTQELYDSGNTHVRSEETTVTQSDSNSAQGIPGAASNKPDGTSGFPASQTGGSAGGVSNHATRNYELDKTIRHIKNTPGTVERLSAAIIVDHKSITSESGEVVQTPLTQEQIDNLTQLVKEAIGFNEARGDSVVVFNQAFVPLPAIELFEEPPAWKSMVTTNLVKQVFSGIALLLLILFVVRPAVRTLQQTSKTPQSIAHNSMQEQISGGLTPEQPKISNNGITAKQQNTTEFYGDILSAARTIAKDDPARVAKLVKEWVGS